MKRKETGFKICLIAMLMFATIVLFGYTVGIKIPEEHAGDAKLIIGVLLGVACGSGITDIINGFRNNKLDEHLFNEMKLKDKIEVTKIDDTDI